ncbi:MAG: acetyltransferase [Pseudodesulfovibrio sp.]
MNVLIIGSGGHARVVADILLAMNDATPLGFTSQDEPACQTGPLGLPLFGDDDAVSSVSHDALVLAIGSNATRKKACEKFSDNGETLISAIHPTVVIAPDVVIEPGCMICAGVVINSGSTIRANTILNTGCTVDHDCDIGPHAHVAPGVNLAGDVTVGEGAFVGIGSCAVQGITIGPWATVGAGAAVVRDVPADTTVVGVPARKI